MLKQNLINKQGMECFQQPAAKQGKVKMKVIPWHCQQRYQSSISQISLNHTLTSAQSTRKIKTLLHNNKCLAKALEVCKKELATKEKADNIDVINFAGIKLKDLSENLKKMTVCVDETLSLLQSHSSTKHVKNFLFAPGIRRDLKQKMRDLSRMEKLEEVVESLENETDSIRKQHFKSNGKSKKSLSKNIKGQSFAAASLKQKSIKKLSKPVIEKLPKNVSQRNYTSQDDSQPSYLLGLSSNLDSFKNQIEKSKVEVGNKAPVKKKPSNSKKDAENFNLVLYSTNIKGKGQQGTGTSKRAKLFQSSINKKPTKDGSKAGKFTSHKKAKMTIPLQDGSSKLQSTDVDLLSSDGKSWESLTSSSSETKEDKIASSLQRDNKILNLNGAFTNIQPIESNSAIYNIHTGEIRTDLETEFSLKQPKIVLRRTDLLQTLKKKEPVPLNQIIDGCHGLSKRCVPSKKDLETLPSAIVKKKVQFLLEEDDGIEILGVDPEPSKRLTVKKTQKRPLRENTQNLASAPKKQALTFGEALQNGDIMNKNTFIVTAEVHKPPDGFISEKNQDFKSINLSNMQPTVVLTDIFKCNSLNSELGSTYLSQIVEGEPATPEVIEENPKLLYSEDASNHNDFNIVSNKENKIGDQNFCEERKQSRRVSSKVSSYKEMKLNVKLRRC